MQSCTDQILTGAVCARLVFCSQKHNKTVITRLIFQFLKNEQQHTPFLSIVMRLTLSQLKRKCLPIASLLGSRGCIPFALK